MPGDYLAFWVYTIQLLYSKSEENRIATAEILREFRVLEEPHYIITEEESLTIEQYTLCLNL